MIDKRNDCSQVAIAIGHGDEPCVLKCGNREFSAFHVACEARGLKTILQPESTAQAGDHHLSWNLQSWTKRVPDETDRRINKVILTKAGQKLEEQTMEMAEETLNEALAGVPPEHIELCKAVLQQVYDNLNHTYEHHTNNNNHQRR